MRLHHSLSFSLICILLAFYQTSLYACVVGDGGATFNINQMLDLSRTIVLGTVNIENGKTYFESVENIKGTLPDKYKIRNSISECNTRHFSENFNNHNDHIFWSDHRVNRAFNRTCGCSGYAHSFIDGEQYLLFPDLYGSPKAAEIIKNKDDRWLQYVKENTNDVVNVTSSISFFGLPEEANHKFLRIYFVPVSEIESRAASDFTPHYYYSYHLNNEDKLRSDYKLLDNGQTQFSVKKLNGVYSIRLEIDARFSISADKTSISKAVCSISSDPIDISKIDNLEIEYHWPVNLKTINDGPRLIEKFGAASCNTNI